MARPSLSPSGPSPASAAYEHVRWLINRLPADAMSEATALAIADAQPDWPVWPPPGLSSLVGPPASPLARLDLGWLHRLQATVAVVDWFTEHLGGPSGGPSAVSLIVERAPLLGHRGWGATSAGSSCRLLAAADGIVAVNLPRLSDVEAVPAWLEVAPDPEVDVWLTIERSVANRTTAELTERAQLLGMAVTALGESVPNAADMAGPSSHLATTAAVPKVVDLSSLWAGPLCGWYLARAGAAVVKVEATQRRDGGADGAFYRRLNDVKTVRALDLDSNVGVADLQRLVGEADIVIEGSRPRALAALGIDAEAAVERGAIWCSITGHGRRQPHRVGFGDDAAVAGSLVAAVDNDHWFVGDAIGDPIAGVTAAALVLGAWSTGRAGLFDVGLAPTVAAHTLGRAPVGQRY